mgnify:CR=1 FL=1
MTVLPEFISRGENPLSALDTCAEQPFERWMQGVDRLTRRAYGVSVHDLPDLPFADNYEAGVSIRAFVAEDVTLMVQEEMGDLAELFG